MVVILNYNNRNFVSVVNTANGEVSSATLFKYKQNGNIVSATYSGGLVKKGSLVGLVKENGDIQFNYVHVNVYNQLRNGICHSRPEIIDNGRIRLHENWIWTSGDCTRGESIIEELINK